MSWFNTSGISSFAKSAISQAQKSIDKVLDIKEENVGVAASSRSTTSAAKSKSYTEGYSRSNSRKMSGEGDDGSESEKHYARSDERQAKEEDSFFSSFLGSDKHSTPKLKSEKSSKLTSQATNFEGNSERASRKPNLKTDRSSRSHFNSSIEPISKGNAKDDVPGSSEKDVMKRKLKGCVEKNEEEMGGDDLLGAFFNDNCSRNIRETKAVTKESARDQQEIGSEGLVSNLSMQDDANIDGLTSMEKEPSKYEPVSKYEDIVCESAASSNTTNGSENLIVQSESCSIDENSGDDNDDNGDGNSIYVDASDKIDIDNAKVYDKDTEQQIDAGRDNMFLGSEEENTTVEVIDHVSSESSGLQETTCEYNSNMKNCNVENLEGENDINVEDLLQNQSITVKKSDGIDNEERNEKSQIEDEKSLLLTEDRSEVNGKSGFVEEHISRQSGKISNVTAEVVPTDIEDGPKREENNARECESIIEDKNNESCEDKCDNPKGGISDEQERSQEKVLSNVTDDANNELNTQVIGALNPASGQEIKDGVKLVGNVGSENDMTAELDCVKEDMSIANAKTSELQKEVKRLQEVVDARESKMIVLSKENIDLQEAVSILRNQLEQAQAVESGENEVIREMREEFTNIVDEMRMELKVVKKERDTLKINLEETMERLTKNSQDLVEDYTRTIKEKEDQITGLLVEGEALSKKELKSNNILKKYRAKVKTLEEKSEQITKQIDEKNAEISNLKETVKEKTEQERTLKEQVKTLELITDQQEDENSKLKDQLDDAEDKIKGMQTTLDSGYQEINRLNLEKANIVSEIEETKQLKTTKVEFEKRVLEVEDHAKQERLAHLEELNNLRLCLTRTEQMSARREDNFQMEIKDLQHRLDGAESRNQELSQSIATASRPLLRQIENLQSSHQNQTQNWERIEKNLTERLTAAQQQMAHVTEKERSAVDFAMEMKSRVSGLELQIQTLREQKDELSKNLKEIKDSSKIVEENFIKEKKSFETYQSNYRKAFEELQNEKSYIEDKLNTERAKHAAELLKVVNEHKATGQVSRQNSSNATQSLSIEGKTEASDSEPDEPQSFRRPRTSSSSSSSNLIDSSNRHTSTAVMEKLQTQLRQKDGELRIHKEEIDSLQKTRASLAQELVSLSNHVEELQDQMSGYDSMKKKYQDMESRYNAALQLYGEKVEEADELRMDLEDVKQMYKQQIQHLFGDR